MMPHDIAFGDVYLPPLLIAAVLGMVGAAVTNRVMVRYGLLGYFSNPPLVFFSVTIIYTVILSSTLFPS